MPKARLARVFATVALLAAALGTSALPAAAAVERPTTIYIELGQGCIGGYATDGAAVTVTRYRASPYTYWRAIVYANNDDGRWDACPGEPQAGDELYAAVGSDVHKLVVPRLTLFMDRVGDVIEGRAPARTTVHVDSPVSADVHVNRHGKWSYHTDGYDILGGELGQMHWTSAGGDVVRTRGYSAQLIVTVGSAKFFGFAGHQQQFVATLSRDLTNTGSFTAIASGKATAYAMDFQKFFRDANGNKVKVKAGDMVSALGLASDAEWVVPQIEAAGNGSTEIVTGRCHDTGTSLGWYRITVINPSNGQARGSVSGWTASDGTFSVDFTDPSASPGVVTSSGPVDVMSNDQLQVWCGQNSGDFAIATFKVP
jgi:hypothetical protein